MKHDGTKLRVAIAKLDGWTDIWLYPEARNPACVVCGIKDGWKGNPPDYLNSHDALAPVLAQLTLQETFEFQRHLGEILRAPRLNYGWTDDAVAKQLRATPAQKCAALVPILGARGYLT